MNTPPTQASKPWDFSKPENAKEPVISQAKLTEEPLPSTSEKRYPLLDNPIEDKETTGTVRIVNSGETISSLAEEVYGKSGLYELALIQIANPEITNVDFVHQGQRIVFPELYSGVLVFKRDNQDFCVIVSASNSLEQIEKWQSQLAANGVKSNVTSGQLSNTIKIYRLEISGFRSKKSAIEKIAELAPYLNGIA